jgi:zinc transport system permease protein
MSYLFGSILFVPTDYVLYVAALDALILLVTFTFFRELQAATFDEEFAKVMGLRTQWLDAILMALVGLAVVTLIRVVGVILVIALLTVPAAIARHWASSLSRMMLMATGIGAVCTVSGLFLSLWLSGAHEIETPTGPLIILVALLLYATSATLRGMLGRSR